MSLAYVMIFRLHPSHDHFDNELYERQIIFYLNIGELEQSKNSRFIQVQTQKLQFERADASGELTSSLRASEALMS